MKKRVNSLIKGQIVLAEVVEELGPSEFIVTFEGDLMRIVNQSKKKLQPGEKIQLVVMSVDPLSFQLAKAVAQRGINLNI